MARKGYHVREHTRTRDDSGKRFKAGGDDLQEWRNAFPGHSEKALRALKKIGAGLLKKDLAEQDEWKK